MRKILLSVVALVVCLLPALASEPGDFLRCEDWVFTQPGFTIESGINQNWTVMLNTRGVVDAEGRWLQVTQRTTPATDCFGNPAGGLVILARQGDLETIVGYLPFRCGSGAGTWDKAETDWGSYGGQPVCPMYTNWIGSCIGFNPITGELVLSYLYYSQGYSPTYPPYNDGRQLCRIQGFTRLMDVQQSYTPAGGLAFYTPYMPEGMAAADYFDTYWGTLDTVGDWSQAQPLQCGYPATAPSVGDYLTVADTLPTPLSGQGYYYVTAVTYQGETRCGRKREGGILSGRDPSLLPTCTN